MNNMKKNILVFLPTASIIVGGGEIAPLSQSQALSKNGHSVTILTVRTEEPTSYYQDFKRRNPQIKFVEVTSPIFGCSYANFINSHENNSEKIEVTEQLPSDSIFSKTVIISEKDYSNDIPF